MESLGERIKSLRKLQGITQSKLSELSKISTMSIRRYETGERSPDIGQIQRIAYALGVTTHELVICTEAPDLKRNELLKHYDILNNSGKGKAVEQVQMLTKIPEYTAPDKEENPS